MSTTKIIGNITGSVVIDVNNDKVGSDNVGNAETICKEALTDNKTPPPITPTATEDKERDKTPDPINDVIQIHQVAISNTERSLFWICIILTMGIAIAALVISLPRTVDSRNPTSLDYQGTIVAIFALLVTALIGWQINATLGIDRRVERYERQLQQMQNRIERTEKLVSDKNNEAVNYCAAMIDLYKANNESNRAEQYLKYADALGKLLDANVTDWDLLYTRCAVSFEKILHLVEFESKCDDDIISFCRYHDSFVRANTRIVDKLWARQAAKDNELIEYIAGCRLKRDELYRLYGNKPFSFEKPKPTPPPATS